ncbi:MAG: nucleotidyltransferase domain-containing protein [Oscillospiraceae bacterium]|jgi:predicted nucleotidyltransferase|nr:nucleotidyltransferase domain-containing protein [Oscillospiraceae bacterium]
MLDKAKVREIAIDYSKEVKRLLDPEKIILFGSYVNGNPRDESDIDIAVLVRGLDDESWYGTRIMLQRIRRNKIFLDIEPHLLDEAHDPSGFVEQIIKTGEVVYQSIDLLRN